MRTTYPWRKGIIWMAIAVSSGVVSIGVVWSQQRTGQPQPSPRIVFGEGHLNRAGKAFHYWDQAKEIPAVCSRCHGANSIPEYLADGKSTAAPHVKNAFACTNCHADGLSYSRHAVASATFPGGVTIESRDNDSNLCMTCHQGRESTASVNRAIVSLSLDIPDPKLEFVHVHYFPAGATLYGTEAKVGYEYDGKAYAGRFGHVPQMSSCTSCHEPHGGTVLAANCSGCHKINDRSQLANLRQSLRGDFDGNGREEGVAREVAGLHRELYGAIQRCAKMVGGASIAFSKEAFPYWYNDLNGNGRVDADELKPTNKYPAYTPRLVQATYNHTYITRDPGAAYHNPRYALQLLYDSLNSLAESGKAGVNMRGKIRP
jgi:hypothetical protein